MSRAAKRAYSAVDEHGRVVRRGRGHPELLRFAPGLRVVLERVGDGEWVDASGAVRPRRRLDAAVEAGDGSATVRWPEPVAVRVRWHGLAGETRVELAEGEPLELESPVPGRVRIELDPPHRGRLTVRVG